ncbi:MAG: hypothetical protein ACOH5I_24505 [Oligoflexus sp.]
MNNTILILFFTLSINIHAQAQVSECEALKVICDDDMALNDLKLCLEAKLRDVRKCSSYLKTNIYTDQKSILNMLDDKSRVALDQFEIELNELYSTLLRIEQINSENNKEISELADRFSVFIKIYEGEVKPKLNEFELIQIQLNNKVNESLELDLDSKVQALINLKHEMLSDYANIQSIAGQTIFALSTIRENTIFFSSKYNTDIDSFRNYLASKNLLNVLFTTDKINEPLNQIEVHLTTWLKAASVRHNRNLQIVEGFIENLIDQKAKSISESMLKDYYNSLSSLKFSGEVAAKTREAFVESTKEMSSTGLPLLQRQYSAMKDFLEFSEICRLNANPKWMESGCINLKRKEVIAKRWLAQLPNELDQNLGFMEEAVDRHGVNKINSAKKALASGDLYLATEIYDEILKGIKL